MLFSCFWDLFGDYIMQWSTITVFKCVCCSRIANYCISISLKTNDIPTYYTEQFIQMIVQYFILFTYFTDICVPNR